MNCAASLAASRDRVRRDLVSSAVPTLRAPPTTTSTSIGRPARGRRQDVRLADQDLDFAARAGRAGRRQVAQEDQRVLGQGDLGAVVEAQQRRRQGEGAEAVAIDQQVTLAREPPGRRLRPHLDATRDRHDQRRRLRGGGSLQHADALAGEDEMGIRDAGIERGQLAPELARAQQVRREVLQRVAGSHHVPAGLPPAAVDRGRGGLLADRGRRRERRAGEQEDGGESVDAAVRGVDHVGTLRPEWSWRESYSGRAAPASRRG